MKTFAPKFETRLAASATDKEAAQALRYRVFVRELGADGPLVDHAAEREIDRFDEFADQLILLDRARSPQDQVIGVYRIMDRSAAQKAGGSHLNARCWNSGGPVFTKSIAAGLQ